MGKYGEVRTLYAYNRDYVPDVVACVRRIMREYRKPMSCRQIAEELEKMGVSTYNSEQAVSCILQRMIRRGEVRRVKRR